MAGVRVLFLGTGDAFGSGGRFQTCMLIESNGERLLLDCGASSLIVLKKAGVDPNSIGAILISHFHGDHFAGVPFFVLDGQFSRREQTLVCAGPPGLSERVTQLMEDMFAGASSATRKFETKFVELKAETTTEVGALRVTPYEVVHSPRTNPYAFRIEVGGRTIAFSGDTEWTDRLVEVAAGSDLFICESYFYDKSIRYHLNYRTLIENRDRLQCARMIVTHLGPEMLDHLADSQIEVAHDGLEITL